MAITQNTFTGDGSTTNYSFTFEYIKQADVKASLDGTVTTAFTLANATTLSFNTAPASGVAIRIFRDTAIDNLKATFSPGSAIKAEDLNDNFTQNNFAVQEADFDVATANTTANTAKTTADTAISTANTASTDASNAVTTANTASTNASAAVSTANTASTNASNAVTTANSAATDAATAVTTANSATTTANSAVTTANTATTTANSAVTTANAAATDAATAVSTANTASTNASNAVSTANSANTTAGNAVTTANAATTTANSAAADAATAVSTANTASTNASNAVTTANSAASDATSAVSTANTASTNASNAVTTANTASTTATAALNNSRESDGQGGFTSAIDKANAAITASNTATAAVSNAVLFDLITNVSSIPGSPSNNDYIEIGNSTGIESFTPLSGLPSGFVGASGLTVRLRYDSSATSWVFMNYFANDSETRYVAIGNPNPVYYANQAAFPSATTYHGGIAHSHADGAMYYAHGGNWIKMAKDSDKLSLAGGTLTGDLTLSGAPTSNLHAASKAYVDTEIADLVSSAPSTLDTLNELAAALGDDANFSTTVTNSIATKMPLAGGTFTGNVSSSGRFQSERTSAGDGAYRTTLSGVVKYINYADGTIKLGGSGDAQTSPNITLNANGTATFAGAITNTSTNTSSFDGAIVVDRTSTSNSCFVGALNGVTTVTIGADGSAVFTGNVDLQDNDRLRLGSSDDLQIYHDGSHSYITNDNSGDIIIRNTVNDEDIILQTDDGSGGTSTYILCDGDQETVRLYYQGNQKLNTKSDGIDVTGEVQCDSLDVDGNADINGQVGFKSAPTTSRTLEVESSSNAGIRIKNASAANGAYLNFWDNKTSGANQNYIGCEGNNLVYKPNNSEVFRIDSSGRLLVGTTTQGNGNADNLTLADSGHCGITIRSGSTHDGSIFFSDATSGTAQYDGYIYYTQNSRALVFGTAQAERMRIHSTGLIDMNISSGGALTEPLRIKNGGSGSGTNVGMVFYNGDGSSTGAGALARIKAIDVGGYDSNLAFEVANKGGQSNVTTEAMRIDKDGRLLVKRTSTTGAGEDIQDSKGGIRSIPMKARTSAYTLVVGDVGKFIRITTGGVTIPSGVFSPGEAVTIYNHGSSDQTITQGSSVTLRNAGTADTGNRTLAQRGVCTVLCIDTNEFVISGLGLS